ncbi:hypothetical protein V8D89_004865 [Ganoderma adspersum]
MDDLQLAVLTGVVAIIVIYAVRWYTDPLHAIPKVGGSSLPDLSYLGAWRTLGDFRERLEEGYRKAHSAFKIATFDRWVVVVSGQSMVLELRKRPADELSAPHAFVELFQAKHVFEPVILSDTYHTEIVKETLLKKLPSFLPNAINEIFVAVNDNIPTKDKQWESIDVMPVVRKIIARTSSRVFFGLPLCRNEEYLALVLSFEMHFMKGAGILRLVPGFMKRRVLEPHDDSNMTFTGNNSKDDMCSAAPYLRPLIEMRMKAFAESGEEGNDKPSDLLQSILERGIQKGETTETIIQRVLLLNFASIGTTSSIATHALYVLAEKPDLVTSLREEVQTSVSAHGWTGAALDNMYQLDSLLRETIRYYRGSLVTLPRIALKDITLHDGTRIPAGTLVSANTYPLHHDAALLEDADKFDPFRYARMRSVEGGPRLKHQFAHTSPEYIVFGYGPHACPGRFFASSALKAALAYIVLNYDMKLAGDGSRPRNIYASLAVMPAPDGLFSSRSAKGLGLFDLGGMYV